MSETLSNIIRRDDRVAHTAALHVEVIADLICPFCFLGKRRLDAALRAVQGPSETSWYPWQLNPEMPDSGMSFEDYLTRRFGSPTAVAPVLETLVQEGKELGIDFRFDKIARVPNTLHAHQLMYLAETEGRDQMALAEALLGAFFERGEDVGDTDVLLQLASQLDIDSKDVLRVIDDNAARQVVQSREAQVRASGISGVPGFLLNRRLLLIGAQETDNIVNAFDRAMFGEGTDQLISPALH